MHWGRERRRNKNGDVEVREIDHFNFFFSIASDSQPALPAAARAVHTPVHTRVCVQRGLASRSRANSAPRAIDRPT